MAGGRKYRGHYDGRNVSVGQDVAEGRGDRGLYGGCNVSGVRMWLEVGETEDSMLDAIYQEPGCGWK